MYYCSLDGFLFFLTTTTKARATAHIPAALATIYGTETDLSGVPGSRTVSSAVTETVSGAVSTETSDMSSEVSTDSATYVGRADCSRNYSSKFLC